MSRLAEEIYQALESNGYLETGRFQSTPEQLRIVEVIDGVLVQNTVPRLSELPGVSFESVGDPQLGDGISGWSSVEHPPIHGIRGG